MRVPEEIDSKFYVPLYSYGEVYGPSITTTIACEHFKDRRPTILEIGVLRGHHAQVMLQHLNPSLMILVDPWDMFGGETHDSNLADTWHRMQGHSEVVLLKATSELACKLLDKDLMFDFIYIDGDHTTEGFVIDLDLWSNRVAPGGILAGHDFNFPNIEEVVRARFGDRLHNNATDDRTLGGEEWWVFV
jgi:predicted O-methyltransferase YrrM